MASLGIAPNDLIRMLFGSKQAMLPAVNTVKYPSNLSAATAALTNPNQVNSGSNNRVRFGLSDFNNAIAAPNVVGAAKHPTGANALRQAAIAAITGQYSPVLGALNNEAGTLRGQAAKDSTDATNRGNRAEGDVATLYSRLRQYAGNTERAQNQDYRAGVRSTKKNFNVLAGQIAGDLSTSGGGVASELKRMGIDPSIALAGAAKDAVFSRGMAREDSANQVANQRSSRREYDAGMGRMKNDIIATGNAAVGTQRAQTNAALSDIARQLSTNLMQVQSQRAQTLGQQAGALGQLKLSQLQARQAAKDPMAHLNMLYKQAQIAKMLGLGSNTGTANKGPGKGMADALAYLQNTYPTTNANWSTQKKQALSQMLEQLYTDSSATTPRGTAVLNGKGVAWDKNTGGDLINVLFNEMKGVKGPKGNPMYGAADQNAIRNAVMIALGAM